MKLLLVSFCLLAMAAATVQAAGRSSSRLRVLQRDLLEGGCPDWRDRDDRPVGGVAKLKAICERVDGCGLSGDTTNQYKVMCTPVTSGGGGGKGGGGKGGGRCPDFSNRSNRPVGGLKALQDVCAQTNDCYLTPGNQNTARCVPVTDCPKSCPDWSGSDRPGYGMSIQDLQEICEYWVPCKLTSTDPDSAMCEEVRDEDVDVDVDDCPDWSNRDDRPVGGVNKLRELCQSRPGCVLSDGDQYTALCLPNGQVTIDPKTGCPDLSGVPQKPCGDCNVYSAMCEKHQCKYLEDAEGLPGLCESAKPAKSSRCSDLIKNAPKRMKSHDCSRNDCAFFRNQCESQGCRYVPNPSGFPGQCADPAPPVVCPKFKGAPKQMRGRINHKFFQNQCEKKGNFGDEDTGCVYKPNGDKLGVCVPR